MPYLELFYTDETIYIINTQILAGKCESDSSG